MRNFPVLATAIFKLIPQGIKTFLVPTFRVAPALGGTWRKTPVFPRPPKTARGAPRSPAAPPRPPRVRPYLVESTTSRPSGRRARLNRSRSWVRFPLGQEIRTGIVVEIRGQSTVAPRKYRIAGCRPLGNLPIRLRPTRPGGARVKPCTTAINWGIYPCTPSIGGHAIYAVPDQDRPTAASHSASRSGIPPMAASTVKAN